MLDRTWTALQRLRLKLPAPLVVADSWFGDSKVLTHVALAPHGTMLGKGKCTDVFPLGDGRRVPGRELLTWRDWLWRDSPQVPRMRSGRLTATSPTYGPVTMGITDFHGTSAWRPHACLPS